MSTTSWVIVGFMILAFLFVVGPIAMHIWGSMFAKGFFSNLSKYFNKKQNTNTNGKKDE
jgi:hypothetical protein